MSLSRAFTTRRARAAHDAADMPKIPERKPSHLLRHKISAPVQLIHTTNMLSYNAPDIIPRSASTASTKSEEDSDTATNAESTPPTSPDMAPGERCSSPDHKQMPSYFSTPPRAPPSNDSELAPAIPRRSPSHTKKNSYDAIARQRSVSRLSRDSEQASERSSFSRGNSAFSRSASTSTRASSTSRMSNNFSMKLFTPPTPPPPAPGPVQQKESHPFGQELAQVTELAEEYGINRLDESDEDYQYMRSHNLVKWTTDDYLSAIQGLTLSFFPERAVDHAQQPPLWI